MRDDHERLMERLRAADPVATPPQPPTFEALLGDADPAEVTPREGHGASTRGLPRRGLQPAAGFRFPRPRIAVGVLAALLAVVVVAIASLGDGGTKLDVVAQARAALSPDGQVVHLVLRGGAVQPDGTPIPKRVVEPDGRLVGESSRRSEQWSTALPLRYLIRRDVLGPDGKPVATTENGRAEDGTRWERSSWLPRVRFEAGGAADTDAANTVGDFGADPTRTVRAMLDRGALRAAGETTVDGRRALRLTGDVEDQDPSAAAPDQPRQVYRIDYLVDPSDYAPLGFRRSIQPPPVPGDRATGRFVLNTELVVVGYERLPLDDTTRALFRPPPASP